MLKNLATFKMVYETRSFSQAAQLLFIAQPTVSAQIKQLEIEFGGPLFIRNGRGELGITREAELLYEEASNMLASWDDLHRKIAGGAHAQLPCRIAVSHTFAQVVLPKLLPQFSHQFPQLDLHVSVQNSQSVLDALRSRSADIGFIEKPLVAAKLRRKTLGDDQLVLAGKSGPWLVREPDSGVNYFTKRYFAEHNVQDKQLEIANNALIVDLLREGFGRAIVSTRLATALPTQPLGANYRRQFYQLTRTDEQHGMLAAAAAELEAKARELLNEMA